MSPLFLVSFSRLKHVLIDCKAVSDRDAFQDTLSDLNPEWAQYAQETIEKGIEPKSNPGEWSLSHGMVIRQC